MIDVNDHVYSQEEQSRQPDGGEPYASAGRVTIKEVADRCGVSRSTVSRVLNNDGRVRPSTVRAVREAVDELGYVPNELARGLSAGTTRSIALVLPDVTRIYYSLLVEGAEDVAVDRSFHIYLKTQKSVRSVLNLWEERRVDGFIIRHARKPDIDVSFVEQLRAANVPVIMIGKPIKELDVPCILVDNVGGARQMAHHFAEHGFRRILVISGAPGNLDSNDRLYGFRLGLREAGLEEDSLIVREGDFSKESGYRVAEEFFAGDQAEAVFAANDRMALGALFYFNERGMRVPNDVALAGFDDAFFAEYVWPPLTTVRQPMYEIGVEAMRSMISWVEDATPRNSRIILPTHLVIRGSCGCETPDAALRHQVKSRDSL